MEKERQAVAQLAFSPISLELLLEGLESFLELVNTSAGVNELLFAGEEGMALGADINSQVAALSGLGFNSLAASASDDAGFVIGMDSVFHCFYLISLI